MHARRVASPLDHGVSGMLWQVWLENAAGQRLGWAASWWNEAVVRDSLRDSALPIWVSLARAKVAVYRDVKGVWRALRGCVLWMCRGDSGRTCQLRRPRRPLNIAVRLPLTQPCTRRLTKLSSTVSSTRALSGQGITSSW